MSDLTMSAVVLIKNTGTNGMLGHLRMANTPIGMLTIVVYTPRRTMKLTNCQSRSLRANIREIVSEGLVRDKTYFDDMANSSKSTILLTSSLNLIFGSHPRTLFAFE